MEHQTIIEIMAAMEEKGEDRATVNSIRDFVRGKQREFAERGKRNNFEFNKNLLDCSVSARDILSIIGVQDDPVALAIFLEAEKEGDQCEES